MQHHHLNSNCNQFLSQAPYFLVVHVSECLSIFPNKNIFPLYLHVNFYVLFFLTGSLNAKNSVAVHECQKNFEIFSGKTCNLFDSSSADITKIDALQLYRLLLSRVVFKIAVLDKNKRP